MKNIELLEDERIYKIAEIRKITTFTATDIYYFMRFTKIPYTVKRKAKFILGADFKKYWNENYREMR